jgi:pimeloyl-ACP methyl ester carboxylesterase
MTKHMVERPLIFVPGILESSLAIGFITIWPPGPVQTADDVFTNLSTKVRASIDEKVPVEAHSLLPTAYDVMMSAIIGMGYEMEKNFWAFPYDWRQSNEISGQMLTNFIEDKNLDSVDIVCHSMGGFISRAAHKQGAPIKRAVYIASPHFGNPMSYFELNPEIRNVGFSNFFEKLAITKAHLIGGATEVEKKWKDLYSKWPSAYELMPDDFYLNNRPIIYSNGHPVLGTNETYLNSEWGLPQNMQDNVGKAMDFKKNLGEKLPEKDDDILVIFAKTLETLDTIGFSSIGVTIDENTSLHFTPPFDFNQHGDTVVVTESAMGSMSDSPVYKNSKSISNFHTVLPNDDGTIKEIRKFLIGLS